MSGSVRRLRVADGAARPSQETPEPSKMPQPKRVDSTADVEGAAEAASTSLAGEIRTRQESIASKRRRAQLNQGLLQRRVQGPKPQREDRSS